MKETNLIYIDIEELYPHPENPRKDVGDVTELAESIKAKGVMQNLTVMKGHWYTEDEVSHWSAEEGYTVLIGHRRMAASKLAGLEKLPCVIVQMEYKDQIATMLLENMQRNDLTVYEQAKGFQMMLDLGDTVAGIAEKSGFSETTIRRRVKLAELDEGKLKAASERQISLMDLDKLNQVEDIKLRNKLLDDIGTGNFNNAIRRALDDQERAKNNAKWRKFFLDAGLKEIDYGHCWDYSVCERNYMQFIELNDEEGFELNGDEQYFAISYGTVYFRKDKVIEELTEARKEEEKKRAERQKAEEQLKEATKRAYELRREFVFGISNAVAYKKLPVIAEFLIKKDWSDEGNGGYYMRYIRGNFTEAGGEQNIEYNDIAEEVKENVYASLLRHAYVLWADGPDVGYRAYYGHNENKRLDYIYDVLCRLGYEMSDEEKQLQDGTHKLFEVFEEE